MKKITLCVAIVCLLGASVMSTSCIGKFALTNRVLSWNNQVGNKFLNELVFVAFWILPVYEVTALADLLVINSIEFWSGHNPMASGTKVINGSDDRYLVTCDGFGYTIESETTGSVCRLDFCEDNQTWSVIVPGNEPVKLMTMIDDTHVALPTPDGTMTVIETSEAGLMAYRAVAASSNMALK